MAAFGYLPGEKFTTGAELFQRVSKQPPGFWVACMPQDYSEPAGVHLCDSVEQATQLAAQRMDAGDTCFIFQGVYVPFSARVFPQTVWTDPASAVLVEVQHGRMFTDDEMIAIRRKYQQQMAAAMAQAAAPAAICVDPDVLPEAAASESPPEGVTDDLEDDVDEDIEDEFTDLEEFEAD
jgi:hypothetical protein